VNLETPKPSISLIGKRLGFYQVEELIGSGGMGQVYRARDTRLQRAVALKVLPPQSSFDAERLARLEREARMLAALNHPNIATIHGLEEAEGTRFLVLELVEGQTLAKRLERGPLPLEQTLDLARQTAEGLEAAHEKGIIHRDLKPANIKITPQGMVKILDFGLAKAPAAAPAASGSQASTLTQDLSRPGTIFGTPAYMSPEQATGMPLDKRTDIWAFGCVFYECLTGQKSFRGGTISEVLAAILKEEPDWQALPATTPSKLKDLLQRCLQKDPRQRLHDIADARIELHEQPALPTEAPPLVPRFSRASLLAAGITTLSLGLLLGAVLMKYLKPVPAHLPLPVARSLLKLESGYSLDGWRCIPPYGFDHPTRTAMAISSDARFLVYSAVKENRGPQDKPRLFLRRLDELDAKPIPGTDGGSSPFLSPDDRWVGFWADRKLLKVPLEGGIPAVLCDVLLPLGFSWGADDQIIFSSIADSGLSRISAAGGKVEPLTTPDKSKDEFVHRLPCCLPGGKAILFTIMRHSWDPQPRVAVLELPTRKWRVLLENAADARFIPPGHLAFLRQGTLLVVPFDLERLQIAGQPVPAAVNVAQALNTQNAAYDTAAGQYSISASGSLVYASGGILPDMQNSLVWVDRQGKAVPISSFDAPFTSPRLSPDGRRIACLASGNEKAVWVYDLARGTTARLTSEGVAGFVAWSPDGRRVAFSWLKTGVPNIYCQPADGSSPMERLTRSDSTQFLGSWSPDGEDPGFRGMEP
jgi:serine/threonine protein kinase